MFFKKNKKKKENIVIRTLIASEQPKSPIAEQYRNIRTNLQFAAIDQELRSLLVTSSVPGEGKTTTTANLGVVFAQQGKKVLVIDGDLRKPKMHTMFGEENIFGLTSVLRKQNTLENCVRETIVENLYFLPSGVTPPNPVELLTSKAMEELLHFLYNEFDLVLIDTPPVLAVTDAQVLANQCDGVVLVVRSGQTEKEHVRKVKQLIQNTKSKLLGVVLNGKQMDTEYYYYNG